MTKKKQSARPGRPRRVAEPPLQALRTPAGWRIKYNDFREVDPERGQEIHFREDLLQLVHNVSGLVVDLGWYPSGNLKRGTFIIHVVENDDWDGPMTTFKTRNRAKAVQRIERLLAERAG